MPFPYNGGDTASGLAHIALGLQRKFQNQDRMLHATPYLAQGWHGVSVQEVPERSCHICGFALISLTFPNGWVLEACSAHEIEDAIKNGSLVNFMSDLGNQHSYNRNDERSKAINLQQPTD